ncbi:hypothetical protein [Priestia megaterium]
MEDIISIWLSLRNSELFRVTFFSIFSIFLIIKIIQTLRTLRKRKRQLKQAAHHVNSYKDQFEHLKFIIEGKDIYYDDAIFSTSSFKSDIGKSIDVTINRSSYKHLENLIVLDVKSHEKKDSIMEEQTVKIKGNIESLVLTSLIVKHTSKSNTYAYLYFTGSLVVYLLLTYLGILEKGILVPSILIIFMLIVFIRQQILVYRIKQGKYGSNKYEIREILTFILDETNKHYFNNNGGNPIVVNDITAQNLNEIKSSIEGFNFGGAKEI